MKQITAAAFLLTLLAASVAPARETDRARERVAPAAVPFELRDVRLLDGPFRDRMLRDQAYLLALDPDRLLHNFRVNAGLPSTARPLGGWEAPGVELRGHSVGHFLTACALMYASTGDERFKTRAVAMVAELEKVQRALPSRGMHEGYLSAFPEELFDRVDRRDRVWAPYYTLHKIMAGLLDVYTLCDDERALTVVTRLADWVRFRVDRLSDDQQQKALETEFGGMNEVLANLYAATGNAEYLRIARKFDHRAVFDPLARGEDRLDGLHANTQIPKAIGAAREYELTGEPRYRDIAAYFWERVAHHRSFAIGGNSDDEAFFPVAHFSKHLGESSTETCNTYNMLKLTRHLFGWSPSAEAMDFYERGLFNHIAASQRPSSGMMTYYVPMKPASYKTFSTPDESFWCCVGTGMENHAKYGDSIYFHDDSSLYVNLFIASELTWREKRLVVRQSTRFPERDATRLSFTADAPVRLALKLRYPSWAKSGIEVTVNGERESISASPGSYVTVEREWRSGDTVDFRLPMSVRVEALPDDPKTVALLYGPIVLAGKLGAAGLTAAKQSGPPAPEDLTTPRPEAPALLSDMRDLAAKIQPVKGAPLTFRTVGIGRPRDVTLVPFYSVYDERYTVYWKVYSTAEWRAHVSNLAADAARRRDIERRTVDVVRIGDDASERLHGYKAEKTDGGVYEGRRFRYSRDGWFSYDLKALPNEPVRLMVTYWGGETRERTFDVLVDDTKIATQTLQEDRPGEFYDELYVVPIDALEGKSRITVTFKSHPKSAAGSVYGVRVVRP